MKKFKTFIFIMLLTLLVLPMKVFAASDDPIFGIGGAKDIKPGQEFSVNVTIKASEQKTLHGYNIVVKYDGNIVEYVGAPTSNGTVSPGANQITISSAAQVPDKEFLAATITFRAKQSGTSQLVIGDGNGKIDCNINGEGSKCTANSGSVTVKALGNDSTLSGLSIPNTTLSPAFNKNTKEYTADVKDVTQLTVNATASDPNASIQISDNYRNLQKGANEITVQVTSEDGAKKTKYKITVNLTLTPTEEELMKANANLSTLEIKGQKIEFNAEEVKYYIDVPYETKELEITATAVNPNAQVAISGNDKLIVGKNTVNIVVTAEDTTTTKTYSILVTRQEAKKKIVPTCPDTTSTKEWIIFSAGLFLTFTLGIVLGYFLCKKEVLQKIFKKKQKQEEPVEIQTLSDTIDLSDVVEEIKDEEDVKKA